jgi:hypothetical protein
VRVSGPSTELRYELKMVSQASAYAWVMARLRMDPAGLRVLHPPRRVQSVYFDSLDQQALEDNLAGISHREKLRFRWYGDEARGVRGKLECKVRENQLGWKDVAEVAQPVDVEGATRRGLAKAVLDGLSEAWFADKVRWLHPVQWISYWREYLSTADGRVRVTLDREVTGYDLRSRWVLTRSFPTPMPRVLIVEAKCGVDAFPEAKRLLNFAPLNVDKCSKFTMASRPGEGPMLSFAPETGV